MFTGLGRLFGRRARLRPVCLTILRWRADPARLPTRESAEQRSPPYYRPPSCPGLLRVARTLSSFILLEMIYADGLPVRLSWLHWMYFVSRVASSNPVLNGWPFVRFADAVAGAAFPTRKAPPESSRSTVISRPFAVTRTVFSSGGISDCGIACTRFFAPTASIFYWWGGHMWLGDRWRNCPTSRCRLNNYSTFTIWLV